MSNLSAFPMIQERSEATPGLFNNVYSILSANIAALNSDLTVSFPSGNTLSIFTNIDASGRIHAGQQIGIGATPSAITTAVFTIASNSTQSDYIHFEDTSGTKSNYMLGSRVGGTADGLNIYDLSGDTMIVSFSKQSIRFFQNVTGPVFDVGGALADTYNAATFGTGAQSVESRIQAAIDQASIDGVSRVYVPANMYPYSASSISFVYPVQMVREGGDWSVYDLRAYGATGDGVVNDYAAVQQVFNAAAGNRAQAFIPVGRFRVLSRVTMPSNLEVGGAGTSAILFFNWFYSSGATSGGNVYLINSAFATSGNTNIRLHDFTVEGDNATGVPTGQPTPVGAGAILFRRGSDVEVSRLRITNCPAISLSYQGVSNARFLGNYISGSGRDGITGGSRSTDPCTDIIIAHNTLGPIGDDCIAVNQSVDDTLPGTTRPTRVVVANNTMFGQLDSTSTVATTRGVMVHGGEAITIVGNSITSLIGKGIYIDQDTGGTRPKFITVVGNTIVGAGSTGTGAQSPRGIDVLNADRIVISSNVVSNGLIGGVGIQGSTYVDFVGNSIGSNGTLVSHFGLACSTSTNTHILIADNVIQGNAGGGMFVHLAQGVVIRNNIIVDNGSVGTGVLDEAAGIQLQGASGQAPMVMMTGNYITDTHAAATKTQSYGIRGVSTSNATYFIAQNYLSGNSGRGVNITGTPNSLIQFANVDLESAGPGNWVGFWSPSAFTGGTALLPGMSFASDVSLGWFFSGASTMALSYGTLLLNSLVRVTSTAAILPTMRVLAGSNAAQISIGRTSQDGSWYAANSNGGFAAGTRVGDVGFLVNSGATMHFGSGTDIPQLSLTSKGGRRFIYANQSGVVSIRTVATSLDSSSLTAGEMAFMIDGSAATLAVHSGSTIFYWLSSASTKSP